MIDLPKQDWRLYEDTCRGEHVRWLRSLTAADALALYADLYAVAVMTSGQQDTPGLKRLEQQRWKQKLAIRKKMLVAFRALDQIQK